MIEQESRTTNVFPNVYGYSLYLLDFAYAKNIYITSFMFPSGTLCFSGVQHIKPQYNTIRLETNGTYHMKMDFQDPTICHLMHGCVWRKKNVFRYLCNIVTIYEYISVISVIYEYISVTT